MYRIPKYHVELVREKTINSEIKIIRNPEDVYNLMRPITEKLPVEYFQIIMLNAKNHVIGISMVTAGTLNASIVHPREVFQRAILANSAGIILTHNHPSGDTTPSQEDINTTKNLVKCGEFMQIPVLDHIITGERGYTSLKEKGII